MFDYIVKYVYQALDLVVLKGKVDCRIVIVIESIVLFLQFGHVDNWELWIK